MEPNRHRNRASRQSCSDNYASSDDDGGRPGAGQAHYQRYRRREPRRANWSANDNGSTILEWDIDDGGMPDGPRPDATSHEWANVEAGTYTITVKARNAGGWSPTATATVHVASPAPTTTPPPTTTAVVLVPGGPTITALGDENRASASWSANDNGSPILEWDIDDGGMPDGPRPDATSHEWANVEAGTYTITVKARNAGGWSPTATATVHVASPAPTTTPPPTTTAVVLVPGRPTITALGDENRASASWSANDNGSPILEWDIDDGGMPDGPRPDATSHEWANVEAGTYTITVKARNAGGWSPTATATVHVTNPAPPPPDKPTITALGDENRASASWSANDNGSPILEWDIDDGGMPDGPRPDATSHEWANVEAGTYTITVKARNAGGWSLPVSKEVEVTDPTPPEPSQQPG